MRSRIHAFAAILAALVLVAGPGFEPEAHAQRRGGGRGAGGGRALGGRSMGGGRPSIGGGRPSMGGNRPSFGGGRPSLGMGGAAVGGRPSIGGGPRPSTLPGQRPGGSPRLPGQGQRPSFPGQGQRPSLPGGGNRPSVPGLGNNPGLGNRPGIGERPGGGLPNLGDRPGLGNRPNIGNGNRPGIGGGNRPGIGNGDRPVIGNGNRPVIGNGNRPVIGNGNRPVIGNGNRPVIGGGNGPNIGNSNRPIIGGDRTNAGLGNVIGNRDNTFNGGDRNRAIIGNTVNLNRPGWGWGGGGAYGWASGGSFGLVSPHYRTWYHGSWNNRWANAWALPIAYGASALAWNGLSSWTSGYYGGFVNPYYAQPAGAVVYDYSQPIVVQAAPPPADPNDPALASEPPPTPEQQRAYALFDQARAAFARNDNGAALGQVEEALRLTPDDPVLHEFRALCLFALGDYRNAAAVLESLLAVAPGWDWTTMSSLYGSVNTYTDQLRNLESYASKHPDDPASHFVLAYHDLVLGHDDAAADALRVVTAQQPDDPVASRMLNALEPPPAPPPADAPPVPPDDPAASPDAGPTTDLIGSWEADPAPGTRFELTITDDGTFNWLAAPDGQAPTTVEGPYAVNDGVLVLQNEQQGDFAGRVTSEGPDRFSFVPVGAPPSDPGLTFNRKADAAP